MGPGQENMMTQEALQVLEASDVIIGYTVYPVSYTHLDVYKRQVIIYANVTREQAVSFAEELRRRVLALEMEHRFSKALPVVDVYKRQRDQ